MFSTSRWSLRLPRNIQLFATSPEGTRGTLRRPRLPQGRTPQNRDNASKHEHPPSPESTPANEPSKNEAVSNALARVPDSQNNLVTPVHIPEDPNGVLRETHPAMRLLDNSAIVVQRQLEMMNVLMGFEQANRYIIMGPHGGHIGYLAEQEHGLGNAMARQAFRTHRSFTTHVFDREEKEILRFHRPFSWINSRIRVYDAVGKDASAYASSVALQGTSTGSVVNQTSANVSNIPLSEMSVIGSAEQEWAPLRRKYNLFLARNLDDTIAAPETRQLASGDLPLSNSKALQVAEGDLREVGMLQFARVDEPFLSWDFSLISEDSRRVGSVNRDFVGFARELFTDAGVYVLRMDAAGSAAEPSRPMERSPGMTLDQRAVMLATAISIDFDYFSRHSGAGGGMWPVWLPWWGGEAAGGAAAGAAGETGVASEAGAAARGLGAGEGAMAGAGTMAGYEAMQRSRERAQQNEAEEADPQLPQANEPYQHPPSQQDPGQQGEEVLGQSQDPWGKNGNDDFWGGGDGGNGGGGSSGGGGGGGGDGGGFDVNDWF